MRGDLPLRLGITPSVSGKRGQIGCEYALPLCILIFEIQSGDRATAAERQMSALVSSCVEVRSAVPLCRQ